jgi:hypothetical protein
VLLAALVATVAACSTAPKPAPPKEAPPAPTFEAFMADAAKARQEGSRTRERDTYRAAAATFPARKEPWAKLADSYFEAADYGNAILAAQEVLQRDAADTVANSMLAVSGLRVSTAALVELRKQKALGSDTRAQAEEIVQSLRDTLGEPVLVPKPTDTAAPARTPDSSTARGRPAAAGRPTTPTTPPAAGRPAAPPRPAASAATPTRASTPTPTPAPAAPARPAPAAPATNPLDRLR